MKKDIKSILISTYHKDRLNRIVELLKDHSIKVYSTGGTASYLKERDLEVTQVEELTGFPSILGGRVKTLHPAVFGAILRRSDSPADAEEISRHNIPEIDCVVVDLYPFEEAVASGVGHDEIIEKIDIGGISLIRAAAKNYQDVVVIPSQRHFEYLENILANGASTELADRKRLAADAFDISSNYDRSINCYLSGSRIQLRYGENPHQRGWFNGLLSEFIEQLNGKELSYNNLLDIDAAMRLIRDFQSDGPSFAIIKHNNACGFATRETPRQAYTDALAGDPVSAFGGIVATNVKIDEETATEINNLFCEVVIAPDFDPAALELLKSKKNRIVLRDLRAPFPEQNVRSALNGFLEQDTDRHKSSPEQLRQVTKRKPTEQEISDLLFAEILVKHTKSNAIVLAKNKQLVASGIGQTSRVDALKQAIHKAKSFGFDLNGCVMASDAFFPFPDCVEIAHSEGITAVIQPGGSIRDQESIDFCDRNNMSMVLTGVRHFKH